MDAWTSLDRHARARTGKQATHRANSPHLFAIDECPSTERYLRERKAALGEPELLHRRFAPWHSDEATSSTPATPASITASRDACAGNRSLTIPHAGRGSSTVSSFSRTGWRLMSFPSRSCATTFISCSRFVQMSQRSGRIAKWRSVALQSCPTAAGGRVTAFLQMLRRAARRSTPYSTALGDSRSPERISAVSASSTAC